MEHQEQNFPEISLEGGAAEALGANGKPQRFYVVGAARSARKLLIDNNSDSPDVMHEIPLERSVVERIFVDAGQTLTETFSLHLPSLQGESAADHRKRVSESWKKLWSSAASEAYKERQGLGRDNLRGNGEAVFRWDVRRQRLEDAHDLHLSDVDALSRTKAVQRLRVIWQWLCKLPEQFKSAAFSDIKFEEDGFAVLNDDSFAIDTWNIKFLAENVDGKILLSVDTTSENKTGLIQHVLKVPEYATEEFLSSIQETRGLDDRHPKPPKDFAGSKEWKDAVLSVLADLKADQIYRFEFGRGPIPDIKNGQVSFMPTESRQANNHAGFGNKYSFANERVELGDAHVKSGEFWNKAKEDEIFYCKFRDGKADGVNTLSLSKQYGEEPKTFFGRSLQGLFIKKGLIALPLRKYVESKSEHIASDIKACLIGFGVKDETIQNFLNNSSQVYDEGQSEVLQDRAFVSATALVDANGRIQALVWCQNWVSTLESNIFELSPSILYKGAKGPVEIDTLPWFESSEDGKSEDQDYQNLKNGTSRSLYIRASGSKSAEYRRLCYALQLFSIAENSSGPFRCLIARVPSAQPINDQEKNNFSPNFAVLADQSQVFGMQRAISLVGLEGFAESKTEEEVRQIVNKTMANYQPLAHSLDALKVFLLNVDAPWEIKLKQTSAGSFQDAKEIFKVFADSSGLTFKKWSSIVKDETLLPSHMRTFFSARVYPTAPQMLHPYIVLRRLLESPNNNMLMGGHAIEVEDDDGQLTALETTAFKALEKHGWAEVAWTSSIENVKGHMR
jgi:hypothetical protein